MQSLYVCHRTMGVLGVDNTAVAFIERSINMTLMAQRFVGVSCHKEELY